MRVVGMIPVRLESSRLPNKPLLDIEGLPMVVHTFKRAQLSKAIDDLYVATDSDKVRDVILSHGGKVIMTSRDHKTGSDRIAEAAGQVEADIIVNIQGDEALLDPAHIDAAVAPLRKDPAVQISMLVTPFTKTNSPSDIKAVLDMQDNIMYSSRTDLPSAARSPVAQMWKVSFIVPFRKDFLIDFASWPQTPLERIEFQEYLRILEHGYKIRAVKVEHADISVDTPEDLETARRLMRADIIKQRYMPA